MKIIVDLYRHGIKFDSHQLEVQRHLHHIPVVRIDLDLLFPQTIPPKNAKLRSLKETLTARPIKPPRTTKPQPPPTKG